MNKIVKSILDTLYIVAVFFGLSYIGYMIGHNNGEIDQCKDLNRIKLTDGQCITQNEYDILLMKNNLKMTNNNILVKMNESMEYIGIE